MKRPHITHVHSSLSCGKPIISAQGLGFNVDSSSYLRVYINTIYDMIYEDEDLL